MNATVAVLLGGMLVTSVWAEEQICRPPRAIIVGITNGIVHQAVDLWGKDEKALQVLIDRGVVLFLKEGTELYVKSDDFDPRSFYKQVRRPGSPDWFWAFSTDYGCSTPEKTPTPADPSPPKTAPKQTKPKGYPPP
jgi:hypothetical protein